MGIGGFLGRTCSRLSRRGGCRCNFRESLINARFAVLDCRSQANQLGHNIGVYVTYIFAFHCRQHPVLSGPQYCQPGHQFIPFDCQGAGIAYRVILCGIVYRLQQSPGYAMKGGVTQHNRAAGHARCLYHIHAELPVVGIAYTPPAHNPDAHIVFQVAELASAVHPVLVLVNNLGTGCHITPARQHDLSQPDRHAGYVGVTAALFLPLQGIVAACRHILIHRCNRYGPLVERGNIAGVGLCRCNLAVDLGPGHRCHRCRLVGVHRGGIHLLRFWFVGHCHHIISFNR